MVWNRSFATKRQSVKIAFVSIQIVKKILYRNQDIFIVPQNIMIKWSRIAYSESKFQQHTVDAIPVNRAAQYFKQQESQWLNKGQWQ